MRTLASLVVAALLATACTSAAPAPSPLASGTPAPLDSATVPPSATPSATPLVVLPAALPPICRGRPLPPGGLVDPCASVSGVLSAVTSAVGELEPDYGQEQVLGLADLAVHGGRLGVLLPAGPGRPEAGAHVALTGALATQADGRRLLTVYALTPLPQQPPSVPAGVLAARRTWADARAAWPLIPPAIILEGEVSGTAAAALYPDGIAHVLVHSGALPDAHTIWHEAGHVYHAAVLRARGRSAALFTAEDEVGTAYWAARRLPGTWAQSLTTGAWASTGFEILAETFAAVNLGDDERASTAGVPLDRASLRAFFQGLAP
jgi:hypothetical protein